MKVRDEIEKYAAEEHKEILLWLFERNHWSSEWRVVAECSFGGRFPSSYRIWKPSHAGLTEYFMPRLYDALEHLRGAGIWEGENTAFPTLSEAAKKTDALFAQMEALGYEPMSVE